MNDASKLVAAPFPINLGGVEWKMSPLTDLDHEELNQWVRSQHVRTAIEAAKGLDRETFDRVVGVALNQAHTLEWTNEDGRAVAGTLNGMAQLIYQSVKKCHPKATPKEVLDSFLSGDKNENLLLAMQTFRQLNSVELKNEQAPEA
jgi:hypothetical protein